MAQTEQERTEAMQRAYRLALGTFVDEFARIEALLYDTLCELANVSSGTTAAISSGIRVQDAMSFIVRKPLPFARVPRPYDASKNSS